MWFKVSYPRLLTNNQSSNFARSNLQLHSQVSSVIRQSRSSVSSSLVNTSKLNMARWVMQLTFIVCTSTATKQIKLHKYAGISYRFCYKAAYRREHDSHYAKARVYLIIQAGLQVGIVLPDQGRVPWRTRPWSSILQQPVPKKIAGVNQVKLGFKMAAAAEDEAVRCLLGFLLF